MKALAVYPQQKQFRVIDNHPEPRLDSPSQVRAQMLEVGICGTDKEIVTFEYGDPPEGFDYLVLGHESLAEIVETGSDVKRPAERRPCRLLCSPPLSRSGMHRVPLRPPGLLLHRRVPGARHQKPPRIYDRARCRRGNVRPQGAARTPGRRGPGRTAYHRRKGRHTALGHSTALALGLSG